MARLRDKPHNLKAGRPQEIQRSCERQTVLNLHGAFLAIPSLIGYHIGSMRIGLLADTHGNLSGMIAAIDHLREERVQKIFHLGHDYLDVQNYINMRRQIVTGKRDYDDTDFLSDFADFLARQKGNPRLNRDLDEIQWLKRNICQVPAADEPQYELESIVNVEFEMVKGKFVAVVHNPKDLSKEDIASANMILYGYTHKAQVDQMQGRYFINPGHLVKEDATGRPPSYGLLRFEDNYIVATIYGLDRSVLLEKKLEASKKRKFSIT